MLPPCVLAIDPGGMTGLAWLWLSGQSFFADEYAFAEAGAHIEDTCARYGLGLFIFWERYWVDRRRPQQDAHHALEMIGVARYFAAKHGCHVLTEGQQHTPGKADQEQLKAIGWWVPGKDDAQSAACHMLYWLRKSGNLPPWVAEKLSVAPGSLQPGTGSRELT